MAEIDLKYGALTIDTSIFDGQGLALESGLLKHLEQFSHSPGTLVLSEIVIRELQKHLSEKAQESKAQIEKALRSAGLHLAVSEENRKKAGDLVSVAADPKEIARGRLTAFLVSTGARSIPVDGASVNKLTQLYFDATPPFEKSGSKKSEFPDAIALMSLERWAEENNVVLLAVSGDKGWSDFAETSKWIDVVDHLGSAISLFQPYNAARSVVAEIQNVLFLNAKSDIENEICDAVIKSLEDARISYDASSRFDYDLEEMDAEYTSHEYLEVDGKPQVNLVRVEENKIVIQVPVEVSCVVRASFSLAVYDSIDKDYTPVGSTEVEREKSYEADALITLAGDYNKGFAELQIVEVEVRGSPKHVNFRMLEPDGWDYEE